MSGSNALLDAIANPKQVDIGADYGTANRLAQGIWANRLAQSQQAAGQAFQNSIGADGTPNQAQLMQNLKADPNAALSAQTSAQAGQTLSADQYAQQMKRLTYGAAGFGQILVDNDGTAPYAAVKQYYDRAVTDGHITAADEAKVMAGFGPDPAANASVGRQRMMQNITAQESLARANGTMTTQTGPGGATIGTRQNTQTGAVSSPPQPGAPQGPDAGTLSGVSTITDSQGVPHQDTLAGHIQAGRLTPAPGFSAAPAPAGGGRGNYSTQPLLGGARTPAPGSADFLSDPDMAGQTEGPPGSKATPVGRPPTGPRSGGTTGPAPGVVDAAKDTATQQAAIGTALVTRADQVPANKASYGNMLTDLAKLDTMGPGTGREATINGVLQKLTGYGITMDKSQVAGAESFAKIANMIAAQQLGSLGPTDARQSLAMGANPHLDLSKLGNTQIIHMLQGNEDAINAKAQAWQKWLGMGNSSGSYGQFSNDFNHNFDPRVFQQRYMGPKEIADLRASMNGPGEAAKFKNDTIYARDQGWIK